MKSGRILAIAAFVAVAVLYGSGAAQADPYPVPDPSIPVPEGGFDSAVRVENPAVDYDSLADISSRSSKSCTAEPNAEYVGCVSLGGPTSEGDVSARSIVPLPAWCLEDFGWKLKRTEACAAFPGVYEIYEVPNGGPWVLVGTMNFNIYQYLYSSVTTPVIANQIQIQPTLMTGAGIGTKVSYEDFYGGAGNFTVNYADFPTFTSVMGLSAYGESYTEWNVQPGSHDFTDTSWTLKFKSPAVPATGTVHTEDSLTILTPPLRCDNQLPGSVASGCVFHESIPNITYDSANQNVGEFADHVALAQGSGLPGSTASGAPLHRVTDSTVISQNRNLACPSSYPRPTGQSCDEYPFASSYEGAWSSQVIFGPGEPRTFPGCGIVLPGVPSTGPAGYSVCMINAVQNSTAGSLLNSQLLVPYRIIDTDAYYVDIE